MSTWNYLIIHNKLPGGKRYSTFFSFSRIIKKIKRTFLETSPIFFKKNLTPFSFLFLKKVRNRIKVFIAFGIFSLINAEGDVYSATWKGRELERLWREATWKVGSFRVQPALFLNNAGYDSNLYHSSFDPVKDYTFTAGPGFYVYFPLKKKILFSIYESPQYVYYFKTEKERTWNNYFKGEIHFIFNKLLFSFSRGYADARERWNTEIDIRPRRKEANLQGSVLWQGSKKTSFSLYYRWARYNYENLFFERFNIKDQLNREENYINFTGFYQLSFRTRFFLDVEYGLFNFENPQSFRDSKSYGIYGGLEFSPFGKIRGRLNLGYKFFDSLEPGRRDYKGIVGNTGVSLRLLRFLAVRAMYRRDVQFSLWYDNTFFVENSLGGGVSIYLFKKTRLDYDYSSGRNSYPQREQSTFGDSINFQKRRDNYEINSVGIYFRLKKNIGIGVTASRWVRHSNLWWENDKRNFIGVNLTYDF